MVHTGETLHLRKLVHLHSFQELDFMFEVILSHHLPELFFALGSGYQEVSRKSCKIANCHFHTVLYELTEIKL